MELFGIPDAVLVQGSAVALLAVFVGAILSGRLVPRKVLEDGLKDRDAMIAAEKARGDEWRAAAVAQDGRNDVQAQQLAELLSATRTTNALIEGLKQASQGRT